MYVKTGQARDFETWRNAVKQGRVFVTSGPILTFTVNGQEPGGTIHLPAGGGDVSVESELATPLGLRSFDIIQNGRPVPCRVGKNLAGGVHRWRVHERLRITQSSWLAARGVGIPIEALGGFKSGSFGADRRSSIAHSASIRVLVGDKPIRSAGDAAWLIELMNRQQDFYRSKARFQREEHRNETERLYNRAIVALEARRREAD